MQLVGLNEQITSARNRKGYSQKEIAAALHISNVQISDLENGESNPSFETFYKLANILEIPADVLLQDVHKNFLVYAIDDYISRLNQANLRSDARDVLNTLLLMIGTDEDE